MNLRPTGKRDMAYVKIPMLRLPAEAAVTLSMHTGASVRVHCSDSAYERHPKGRQVFDPAHAPQIILEGVEALRDREELTICDAAGRITVQDIRSPVSLPRFDNSAMEGYGLRIDELEADGSAWLPIVDRIQAGRSMTIPVSGGAAVRITTGAQVPQCVAAVIPDEDVDVEGSMLRVRKVLSEGANIRPRGEDIGRGKILVPMGTPYRRASQRCYGSFRRSRGFGTSGCHRRTTIHGRRTRRAGRTHTIGQDCRCQPRSLAVAFGRLGSGGATLELLPIAFAQFRA